VDEDLRSIIEKMRTIYIFGVTDEGHPYIILPTRHRFRVKKPVEALAKVEVEPPLAKLIIRLKQGKIKENINALIFPTSTELRDFTEAIGDVEYILLSLMPPSDFKNLYLKIARDEDVDVEKYRAITFQIPVDGAKSLKILATMAKFMDWRKLSEFEEVVRERQEEEMRSMGLE